jgi:DNA (cytosine-5)-methyltransferase 1
VRLQGFPDDFGFPDTVGDMSRYKQAGNSVVVPLVRRIGEEILKIFE